MKILKAKGGIFPALVMENHPKDYIPLVRLSIALRLLPGSSRILEATYTGTPHGYPKNYCGVLRDVYEASDIL